ncbi:leukotriene B4 receptor 1-like [Rhinatrema bivittatum]|uniref:leukotriene B4 receptor 1-like n=1 Tax=Rhinatrema bivittatum TaxID=194408 RepID=UPI0011290B1E|nr:leukotriene B4 receptor 1-like [Rhinatrema bivittatum]XP_029436994.1 leukotriene B4 receptor 1-like [Rhinatrema bivittatum]
MESSTSTSWNASSFMNETQPSQPVFSSSSSSSSASLGIAILSVALLVGFPGNAFIIWTILVAMKKRTVTCVLILHLAVADMAVLLTAPLFIHLLATRGWVFGEGICKICHYICCLSMFASILLISFMSLDRFLAVAKPFLSQKVRTKPVVLGIVMTIWVLAALLAIPMPFYRTVISFGPARICMPYHPGPNHIVFQYLFETIFGFALPFAVLVASYAYIGCRLRSAKFQRKRKTGRLIAAIVVAFALFWLPYHVVNLIQVAGNLATGSTAIALRKAAATGRPNVTALAFFSSSVNPVLYAFAGSGFIRSAGLGFMAKVFEGTASEVSSVRKASQMLRQRSRIDSVELEKMDIKTESRTISTNPTDDGQPPPSYIASMEL